VIYADYRVTRLARAVQRVVRPRVQRLAAEPYPINEFEDRLNVHPAMPARTIVQSGRERVSQRDLSITLPVKQDESTGTWQHPTLHPFDPSRDESVCGVCHDVLS